jgi:hypothetical protein
MPYLVRVENGILFLTLSGVLTRDDFVTLAKEAVATEAAFDVIPHRVVDFSTVTAFDIDYATMHDFAATRLKTRFPNSFKSAHVAPELAQYGYARMFQNLNDHPQITIAIFPTVAAARKWLQEPGLDGPPHQWAPHPA